MAPLTKRERELLEIVAKQKGRLTTKDIYAQAGMARATSLKYLAVLAALGYVYSESLGPVKIWWPVKHCSECGGIMKHEFVPICPYCISKKQKQE